MPFEIPQPLKIEHEELHAELVRATKEPGPVGQAAKTVARLLHPHFEKEERYALPPLGALRIAAEEGVTPDMTGLLAMTDRLAEELPRMLQEHQAIVAALRTLDDAARTANLPRYQQFAQKLIIHARSEEEVTYPAAILLGEYVRLKLAATAKKSA